MEWVQVPKHQLFEYIHYVEQLNADHTKLSNQLKDAKELAAIVEETWQQRLDNLRDEMLDYTTAGKYLDGLMRGYRIMSGQEKWDRVELLRRGENNGGWYSAYWVTC